MPTEKTEGLEVVAQGIADDLAKHMMDRSGLGWDRLESAVTAAVKRAWEEGREAGLQGAAQALEVKHLSTDYRGRHSAFPLGFEAAMDIVDALLPSPPPPDNEQEG